MKAPLELRAFIGIVAVGLLAGPFTAEAQSRMEPRKIGILETVSPGVNKANLAASREGLRALGYVEGQNLVIVYRSVDGHPERFPDLAAELVRLKVDLILTRGTMGVAAAKGATGTIPIVMAASGDPLGAGLVQGLARPGGNVTGLSSLTSEVSGKRLQLLKEAIPSSQRVAVLLDMGNPTLADQWRTIDETARSMRLRSQLIDVRSAERLEAAFEAAVKERADAAIVGFGAVMQNNIPRIVDLATRHRLPSIYPSRDKTAKALGLTIPQSLLLRADQVIE